MKAGFRSWTDGKSRVFHGLGFIMKYMRDSREKRAIEMREGAIGRIFARESREWTRTEECNGRAEHSRLFA
jgi:hypothetical protein